MAKQKKNCFADPHVSKAAKDLVTDSEPGLSYLHQGWRSKKYMFCFADQKRYKLYKNKNNIGYTGYLNHVIFHIIATNRVWVAECLHNGAAMGPDTDHLSEKNAERAQV